MQSLLLFEFDGSCQSSHPTSNNYHIVLHLFTLRQLTGYFAFIEMKKKKLRLNLFINRSDHLCFILLDLYIGFLLLMRKTNSMIAFRNNILYLNVLILYFCSFLMNFVYNKRSIEFKIIKIGLFIY